MIYNELMTDYQMIIYNVSKFQYTLFECVIIIVI